MSYLLIIIRYKAIYKLYAWDEWNSNTEITCSEKVLSETTASELTWLFPTCKNTQILTDADRKETASSEFEFMMLLHEVCRHFHFTSCY